MNIDAIQFWGQGQFKLTMTAPFGPGSIRLANSGGGAGNGYWTAVTLTQGAFPNGWLFGVDIGLPELLSEVAGGAPFSEHPRWRRRIGFHHPRRRPARTLALRGEHPLRRCPVRGRVPRRLGTRVLPHALSRGRLVGAANRLAGGRLGDGNDATAANCVAAVAESDRPGRTLMGAEYTRRPHPGWSTHARAVTLSQVSFRVISFILIAAVAAAQESRTAASGRRRNRGRARPISRWG